MSRLIVQKSTRGTKRKQNEGSENKQTNPNVSFIPASQPVVSVASASSPAIKRRHVQRQVLLTRTIRSTNKKDVLSPAEHIVESLTKGKSGNGHARVHGT